MHKANLITLALALLLTACSGQTQTELMGDIVDLLEKLVELLEAYLPFVAY